MNRPRAAAATAGWAGSRLPRNPLSIAGLLAVLLVMAGSHVVVARYDMLALDVLESGCIFIGDDSRPANAASTRRRRPARRRRRPVRARPSRPNPGADRDAVGGEVPDVSTPPWDGQEQLNILLIGSRQARGRPDLQHRHADRRVDRSGHQAGRHVQPAARHGGRARRRRAPHGRRSGRVYTRKINAWLTQVRGRSDLFPGNSATRGYNGLKAIMGNLYDLDIKYFVEVNFDGLQERRRQDGRGDHQRPDARCRTIDSRRRRAAATGLHPERDPAHGRRPGAPLRPLATYLERLRPRLAPAARAHFAARAGRPAGAHPAPARARRPRSRRRSGPTSRSTSWRSCSGSPRISTRRTSARTSSRRRSTSRNSSPARAATSSCRTSTRSGPRSSARSPPIPADEAQRQKLAQEAAAVWVLNSTGDRDRGTRRGRLPRVLRAGRLGAAPEAAGRRPGQHEDRRLQRCRARPSRTRSPISSRRSG